MSIANQILKLLGWKVDNRIGYLPPKAVIIAAPHTSMWDFFYGYIAFRAMGLKVKFLIKKEAFFFPLGTLLGNLGGIPVNRFSKNSVVEDVVKQFNDSERMVLTITPEATREKVKRWKNGYHRIAAAANVPVIIGFIDYKIKTAGVIKVYDLQGDSNFDTLQIMKYYTEFEGKFPENFYLPPEVYS